MSSDFAAAPTAGLRFRFPWRPYQEEILRDFATHIADRHFHIVAAPGSGKTVLGLEALRLLERPALILAPTVVIREQWIERLLVDFAASPPAEPEWVSRDPRKPGWWTFSTYQALASCHRMDGPAAVAATLGAAGVTVLVVDEAHHLRAHWWRCLNRLKRDLSEIHIISLTATPPFDVPQAEWNRYATFCGEVDAEITAPELVATGSLCPHQDLVHLTVPLPDETAGVAAHQLRAERLFRDLCLDSGFAGGLAGMKIFADADSRVVLEHLDFFLAAAIYLAGSHGRIPPGLLDTLDLHEVTLPPFDLRWMEFFLTGLFFGAGQATEDVPRIAEWKQRCHEAGLIHRRKIETEFPDSRSKAIARSVRKLDAIVEIISCESSALGERLRTVVLCDRIRERDFPSGLSAAVERPFTSLGVVPAFESVRRLRMPGVRPAVLTGSLIVLPCELCDEFSSALAAVGGQPARVTFAPLVHDPDFVRIGISGGERQATVAAMTRLFEQGRINALFGTAALLGEGWDAPAINTLVIASSIVTFVTSNQLRGRAIRTWRKDAAKTANIWHLATVCEASRERPGCEFVRLRRRFNGYSGVGEGEDGRPMIRCGLAHLGFSEEGTPPESAIEETNAATFRRAADRERMRRLWREALPDSRRSRVRPIREVGVPERRLELVFGLRFRRLRRWKWLQRFLLARWMRAVATAIFDALREAGHLRNCPPHALVVRPGENSWHAGLAGRPAREQVLFSRALVEVLDPWATKPRYLLVMKSSTCCVPAAFGSDAESAAAFSSHWRDQVGAHRLVFSGSAEGRWMLVGLRGRALLDRSIFAPEIGTRWT